MPKPSSSTTRASIQASMLHFDNISDAALEAFFGEQAFRAAQKLIKQGAVKGVEYNPSDKAVYGVIETGGQTYNLDLSENAGENVSENGNAQSGIEYNSDIEDDALEKSVAVAVLQTYRDLPDYATRHGVNAHIASVGEESKPAKKSAKKSVTNPLKSQLLMLSSEELADLLMGYAERNPDVKRDLSVRFQTNSDEVLKNLTKDIAKIFPKTPSGYNRFSASTAAKTLNTILSSIAKMPRPQQIKPFWAIGHALFTMHATTLLNSKRLDEIMMRCMNEISAIHAAQPIAPKERQEMLHEIITLMQKFATAGYGPNHDDVKEFTLSLCLNDDDYNMLITSINAIKQRWVFERFQVFLEELYTKTKNTEGKRQILERNLNFAKDYLALATYWQEEKNAEKVVEVARKGLHESSGDKTPLLRILEEYYLEKGDYEELWNIFEETVRNHHKAIRPQQVHTWDGVFLTTSGAALGQKTTPTQNDSPLPDTMRRAQDVSAHPYYTLLLEQYKKTDNYGRVKSILELAMGYGNWSLKLFTDAEKFLHPEDASTLQTTMLQKLERMRTDTNAMGYYQYFNAVLTLLTEIYAERQELPNLWSVVEKNMPLMLKFEPTLAHLYSSEYVILYKKHIATLVHQRSNYNYHQAASILKRIEHIMTSLLGQQREWTTYIARLRVEYKAVRNFMQELDKL